MRYVFVDFEMNPIEASHKEEKGYVVVKLLKLEQ